MPRGNGTGPPGGGGRGTGRGAGRGSGRGRMAGFAAGPEGACVCPRCGKKVAHKAGVPCYQVKCPECGTTMTRQR